MAEIHEDHGPDCTCGCHDHDHEHGDGNSHHHEHVHEHDHDHGPDCTCGCHDHDHDHHHEHTHEREVELGWGTATLESHVHDQAATVSATIHAQSESSVTFDTLIMALQDIAQRVESEGAIVGHIKAYARSGESFAHASATDAQHAPACDGDSQLPLASDVQCQLVAIALLIDLPELEQIVLSALG